MNIYDRTGLPDVFCCFMAKTLTKNGQNCCFLKKLWPKIQNAITMVIYIIIIRDLKYSQGSILLLKISGFTKEASFNTKIIFLP